jgi:hypothetical protein
MSNNKIHIKCCEEKWTEKEARKWLSADIVLGQGEVCKGLRELGEQISGGWMF